jgi:3-oxoacyl-[acyl-carrier-protein] synthase III
VNTASVTAVPWRSRGQLAVLGTGLALPGRAVPTDDLIALLEDRFAFSAGREAKTIARHMGIATRHLSRPFAKRHETALTGCSNADLSAIAVSRALDDARLLISDIGYVIGHTTTPVQPLPGNVAFVADRLGYAGPHVELRQACTGFANALMIAFGLMAGGLDAPVVIVGSETGSLFFDPDRANEDRGQRVNLVQMGDAAAAVVVAPAVPRCSLISGAWFGATGLGRPPGLQMHAGRREFDHDYARIAKSGPSLFAAGLAAAASQGITPESVDYIVPHQVSGSIRAQIAAHLGVDRDRVFGNADRVGNTGSAAMWLALAELRAGSLASGARLLALGAEATKYMHGGFLYEHCVP